MRSLAMAVCESAFQSSKESRVHPPEASMRHRAKPYMSVLPSLSMRSVEPSRSTVSSPSKSASSCRAPGWIGASTASGGSWMAAHGRVSCQDRDLQKRCPQGPVPPQDGGFAEGLSGSQEGIQSPLLAVEDESVATIKAVAVVAPQSDVIRCAVEFHDQGDPHRRRRRHPPRRGARPRTVCRIGSNPSPQLYHTSTLRPVLTTRSRSPSPSKSLPPQGNEWSDGTRVCRYG